MHTRDVPLAPTSTSTGSPATTPGMVGADLANLVNEAALLAARRGHEQVRAHDFTDALERIVLGAERKMMLSRDDRRRTAYHEAGHAVVGMLTPGADPVRKVSIIPRGSALGVTLLGARQPIASTTTRPTCSRKIRVALGGRVAEEIVYGDVTTGAESDIQQLTEHRPPDGRPWGMSDAVGLMVVVDTEGGSLAAPETLALLDGEVSRFAEEAYADVLDLIQKERPRLEALAEALLERETLDAAEAYAVVGLVQPPRREDHPPLAIVERSALERPSA